MAEQRSILANVTESVRRMGAAGTVRQMASMAAIAWGTRSAMQQAEEAHLAVDAAMERLADVLARTDTAEAYLAEVLARIANADIDARGTVRGPAVQLHEGQVDAPGQGPAVQLHEGQVDAPGQGPAVQP